MKLWKNKLNWGLAVTRKKVKILIVGGIVVGVAHLLSAVEIARAQSSEDRRKTTIDFEDELIEGELKKPELFYLLQKKQFNFKRLIKLRNDFLPEMRRTSEELRHTGSSD